MTKKTLLASACCCLLPIAHGIAQTQTSGRLEEIVVTAQRVRSSAQRTPIAIQTINGRTIVAAGINNARDLQRIVPGLTVQFGGGGGASFFIRGVGNRNLNATNDNGLAIDLDQVFFSRGVGPDLVFYDLDRVEVLKGPQGTLYGRNATGGSINLISTKPVLGKFDGYARLELGDYGEVKSNAAINVPISDTLAARVAMQTVNHDPYTKDGYDNADTQGVRTHVLWKPTADFSALVSAEWAHDGGTGPDAVPYPNDKFLTSDPYDGGGSPQAMAFVSSVAAANKNIGFNPVYFKNPNSCVPGCIPAGLLPTQPGPYQVRNNGYLDNTIVTFRADLEWNLGFANLTVIPAILNTNYRDIFYPGPQPVYNKASARQQSIEARLASPQNQALTWIGGVFYENEHQSYFTFGTQSPNTFGIQNSPDLQTKAGGVFAQATYRIIPTLSFTAGVRYSVEDKANYNSDAETVSYSPGGPFGPNYAFTAQNTEHAEAPTFRAGFDWQVRPTNLLYTYFSTGFHSGGLEPGAPATRPICQPNPALPPPVLINDFRGCDEPSTYQPEFLKAYTVGSKNRFFDNRLQVNVEAYDWEYQNLQVLALGLGNPDITVQRINNAGNARVRGVDIEARAQITPNDALSLTANYNSSAYGPFVYYTVIYPVIARPNILTGKQFSNAPAWSLTGTYAHDFDLPSGARLTPSITVQYKTKTFYFYNPLSYQVAYTKIDMDLTYRSPRDRYELGLFVRNLTNVVTLFSPTGSIDPATNVPWVNLAPPRTFGGSATVNF